ncbi:hypothetical protein NUU61_003563 [Penicillium alfredii]|uniref:Xylanolytic transcriptional activator regulatory domain-containing protein n=1 Tax=Penicillium alfredii TaxID=1506179 RepID=A0A9W9KD17_9EURO|nr:uncharacterized protein NUU61_003563 [Penicillium alfredii]KAJ5101341.1 hypothetical protein NUU61_003563 [Penicillium alfredii]
MSSNLAGTFHWHYEMGDSGRPEPVHRNVRHKTRLFGQSHWVNGLTELRDVLEIMEPLLRDGTRKASYNLQRCKSLAKIIKARRAPTWPTPPTSDIPPKEVADTLIECYLRTFETIYRVLHVPSFRRDYEALWVSETEPNTAFLVQLKLILALGTIAHDEQFSLRTSAVRWVYEAQTWLSEPEFKSRLNIQFLQTNILLLLARENIGVNGGSAWISAGVILRIAVLMGLHQDPACLPQGTTFALEMRRRMWNVVLEITLQSSMEGGAPPLLSLDDFDTEPPGNFDDDQLMAQDPIPKSEHEFTGMSMVIALRKMFPLRLAILKYLNGLSSHSTYDQTLRFDAQIRASYKTLCQILQQYKSTSGASPSRFEICTLDSLMCRYLSALHVPYLGAAIHEIAYAYSRKVVVETALKAWYVMYPPSPSVVMAASRPDPGSFSRDDFARFVTCGSGQHRHIAVQACYHIVIELKTQLQQEDSLGPVPLRPDLLAVLHDAKAWFIQSIRAGETSIKCYMFMDIVFALLDGLSRGVAKDELPEMLVTAAEEAEDVCLPILEQMAGQSQFEESFDELDNISGTELPDFMDGWDFMMPDASFDFGITVPTS